MKIDIRPYHEKDETAVVQLWHDCRLIVPQNDPHKDIRRKGAVHPDLFLVGLVAGRIVATIMAGYDGHRGWLNYLAVTPALQRKGLGRQMVAAAEQRLRGLGCPKINLQVRKSNSQVIEFYKKLGFLEDNVLSLGKRLETDNPLSA
jgi:ribosomal protein S18 acetylase RimI-like enzyme